jgi:bifunctional non-homologous end joining protein LigD
MCDVGTMVLSMSAFGPMPWRLVRVLAGRNPRYYMLSAQRNRRGRIFLDYLRNGRGTTASGASLPRVPEGFPIAAL